MLSTRLGPLYVLLHLILISSIPFLQMSQMKLRTFCPELEFKLSLTPELSLLTAAFNTFRLGEWKIACMYWIDLLSCSALDRVSLSPSLVWTFGAGGTGSRNQWAEAALLWQTLVQRYMCPLAPPGGMLLRRATKPAAHSGTASASGTWRRPALATAWCPPRCQLRLPPKNASCWSPPPPTPSTSLTHTPIPVQSAASIP